MRFLTACGLVAAFVSVAAGQGTADRGAKVIRLKGFARFTTGNFIFQPLTVGQVLQPGTVIQTSADEGSYVDIVLGDANAIVPQPMTYRPSIPNSMSSSLTAFRPTSEQNVVRIWGDSALGVDKLTALQTGADLVTETELDLKRGRISCNVKKLPAASKYEVKLPNGIAGVRGTFFDMHSAGIIKVYIGSIVVAWVDPATQNVVTQTLVGGQQYDAPTRLVSLLSTDSLSALQQLSLSLVVAQTVPTTTTLASDRTVVGMSPVGAEPGSVQTGAHQ